MTYRVPNLCAAVGLLCVAAATHAQVGAPSLYLLGASRASASPAAVLYQIGPDARLVPVRTLGASQTGERKVVSSEDTLFVVPESAGDTTVSLVHKSAPLDVDEVPVALPGRLLDQEMIAARETANGTTRLLLPTAGGLTAGRLIAIDASVAAAPRTEDAGGEAFPIVDYLGRPASEVPAGGVPVWEARGTLALADHPNVVCDDQVPQSLHFVRQKNGPPSSTLVASSDTYVLFLAEPEVAVPPRADTTLYLHDRDENRWTELRVDGSNNSSMRLFGPWLAVRVEIATGLTGTQSSAVSSTGRRQQSSDHLPGFPQSYFPGYALLRNLETGREVRLKTGIADTEVELVTGDAVLYRVQQKLFHGRIEGKNVVDPELLVDDPAMVNVHWVFPAPPAS